VWRNVAKKMMGPQRTLVKVPQSLMQEDLIWDGDEEEEVKYQLKLQSSTHR
jgi:hypothetical protein